jgi:hypothetical protein
VTNTYDWRADQLNRLVRMLKQNYESFANDLREDFKTAPRRSALSAKAVHSTVIISGLLPRGVR